MEGKGERTRQRNVLGWFGAGFSPHCSSNAELSNATFQTNSLNSPQPSTQHDSNASFLSLMPTLRADVGLESAAETQNTKESPQISSYCARRKRIQACKLANDHDFMQMSSVTARTHAHTHAQVASATAGRGAVSNFKDLAAASPLPVSCSASCPDEMDNRPSVHTKPSTRKLLSKATAAGEVGRHIRPIRRSWLPRGPAHLQGCVSMLAAHEFRVCVLCLFIGNESIAETPPAFRAAELNPLRCFSHFV